MNPEIQIFGDKVERKIISLDYLIQAREPKPGNGSVSGMDPEFLS